MFDLIKNFVFFGIAFYAFTWFSYLNSDLKLLAEKYETEDSLPQTFLVVENQRISFSGENKGGSMTLSQIGIGLTDYGLYLSRPIFLIFIFNFFPSALLIPWSDISYRKVTANNYSDGYYTFYLGNPRMVRFSLSADTIERLERDYGEPIFRNKLGEPE